MRKELTLLEAFTVAIIGKRRFAQERNLYIGKPHYRRNVFIYHRFDCESGRKIGFNGALFENQSEAVDAGYRPCKTCMPDRHPYSADKQVPDVRSR